MRCPICLEWPDGCVCGDAKANAPRERATEDRAPSGWRWPERTSREFDHLTTDQLRGLRHQVIGRFLQYRIVMEINRREWEAERARTTIEEEP